MIIPVFLLLIQVHMEPLLIGVLILLGGVIGWILFCICFYFIAFTRERYEEWQSNNNPERNRINNNRPRLISNDVNDIDVTDYHYIV